MQMRVCSMYSVPPAIDCLRVAVVVQQHEPMRAFWRHPEKSVRRAGDSKPPFFFLHIRSRAVWLLLPTLTSLTAAANPPKCNEGFFLPLHWQGGYWMIRVELNDIISPPLEDNKKPILNIYLNWRMKIKQLDGRIIRWIRPPQTKNVWAILVCGMSLSLPSIV